MSWMPSIAKQSIALHLQEEFRQWSLSRVNYERYRPETTLLYQIIQEHWSSFQAELGRQGKHLPKFVTQEFEKFLKYGRLEHSFQLVRCESRLSTFPSDAH